MLDLNKGIRGARVLVVGMARSGVSSAKMLDTLGAKVIINDARSDIPEALAALGFEPENALGKDPMTLLGGLDAIVLSPGAVTGDWNSRRGATHPATSKTSHPRSRQFPMTVGGGS